MSEKHLIHTAVELVKELDKAVGEHLPETLAGIVKLHARLAIGTAFIPIPGADVAAAAANTWAMYVRINKELKLPFGENLTKSLAAGVMTNIGSNVAGLLVFSTFAKFIPGPGTVAGGVVLASMAYALTLTAGIVYMKALTKLLRAKAAHDITESDLKHAADGVLEDKATIRAMVKDAKKNYKAEDGPPPPPPAPPAAPSRVFLSTGGQTYGPYVIDDVRRMRAAGQLAGDTQFWTDGMASWSPIARFPH